MKTSYSLPISLNRMVVCLVLMLLQVPMLMAGDWVDITDSYVKNPRYDGNDYSYWDGTPLSGANARENAEHYWKTYNTYQRVEGLVPGKYRVSLTAFYRMGDSGNDYNLFSSGDYENYQYSRLYASSSVESYMDTPIACLSSGAQSKSLGGGTSVVGEGLYVPNNMEAAGAWFAAGFYYNVLECEVGEDGVLIIGIKKDTNLGSDWTCLDNWKLEYYEDEATVRVESLKLNKSYYAITVDKSYMMGKTILPDNATNKKLVWTSSDESVATVSGTTGKIKGMSPGKAVITAKTTDLSNLSASCLITVYSKTDEEVAWIDVTDDFVINPRFENNDLTTGWEGTPFSAANPKENAEHYNKDYFTYQWIDGLVPGKYRLSLDAFYRMGTSNNDYQLYQTGEYEESLHGKLVASSSVGQYSGSIKPLSSGLSKTNYGGGTYSVYVPEEEAFYYAPNNMYAADAWFNAGYYQNSLECEVGEDGRLQIGIYKDQTIGEDWTCLDNWKLEYYGPVKLVTDITLSQTDAKLVRSETLQLDATVLPKDAIYRKLVWTSSDETVATVDRNGLVTAVGMGTAEITAAASDCSGVSATCHVMVINAEIKPGDLVINEIMVHNVDVYLDPSYNFGPWVELYNAADVTLTLGGLYVTDDPANLTKNKLIEDYGVVPANGYAILNFDHFEVWKKASYRQINDDLNAKGGTIILSDGKTILAQQDYPEAISRMSWARKSLDSDDWGYTGEPTPGESNATSKFATEQLAAPVVDIPSKLFDLPFNIQVTIPAGTTLLYTTDGTAPTLTNGYESTDGKIYVDYSGCYRFRLFQNGKLPSQVVTRSYIKKENDEPFPIISLVTDWDNIWGDYGVFLKSSYGRPGNGQSESCNWNMDWDRPVHFDYITTEGECVVSQECDLSMCGGWSRAFNPHAFKLKAKKTYDMQNSFDYQFFENKSFLKHKTLQIRNGGNDTGCRIKDGAIQGIIERSGIYAECQSWKPVHVYINGWEYAVLNMREPNNKDYAYSNYGIDSDLMDQFEISPDSGYVQMRGTEESFLQWYELAKNAADEDTYEQICKLVDIDNYINYMAIELYIGNWDWPQNNVKGFRSLEDGKFRFVIFDLDGALSSNAPLNDFFSKENYTFDNLHGYNYATNESIEGTRLKKEIKFVTIFKNMIQNEEFFKKFIDAYCLVAGSVFTPELTYEVVMDRANELSQGDYVNPWSTASNVYYNLSGRQTGLINHLQSYFKLNSGDRFSASLSSNIEEGRIMLNDQEVPTGKFSGDLFLPVTLRAEAPAGYKFAGWAQVKTSGIQTIFEKGSEWKFYDKGSLDDISWKAITYSDAAWNSGATPIGYDYNGQHPELVTVTQGYLPTYYLRKSFNLSSVDANGTYQLDWVADDGFVVYVNGKEAGRYNMPSGTTSYSTFASTYANNNPDAGTMLIDASLLRTGNNLIAVELHNNASNSTDIYWNAAFGVQSDNPIPQIVSLDPEYTFTNNDGVEMTAMWDALPEEELIANSATPVKINEVSAANSVYINEYFKKNDWIELYNTTDKPVDVAGMYISDKLKKPLKFQIPAASEVDATYSTVIPAHGYLVIWADQLVSDTQIHTGFKLGNEDDEVVMLTAADESWADTLSYKMHNGDQSVGLYPDGGKQAYIMDLTTIGQSNKLNSYAVAFEQFRPEPTPPAPSEVKEITSDGELRIKYENGGISITTVSPMTVSIEIVNAAGQKVYETSTDVYGSKSVGIDGLSVGIYLARVTSDNDNRCQIKFLKK